MNSFMDSIRRDYKDMLIVILLIGILAMTIIYANFTRRLNIVSANEIKSSDWNVHFENLVQSDTSTATVNSPATIAEGKTVINSFNISLKKPGDFIKYTFDVYNAGKIDAKLDGFEKTEPVCSPSSYICDNISYIVKYTDNSEINPGHILKSGERKNITLIIKLSDTLETVPNMKIDVSNLTATFYYVQK